MGKQSVKFQLFLNIFVHTVLYGTFAAIITLYIIASFYPSSNPEAYIGDFSVNDFNDNWTVDTGADSFVVSFPYTVSDMKHKEIVIKNTIPDYVNDDMTIEFRSSMEDMYIFVDGELRSEYYLKEIDSLKNNYIPSAYVFANLSKEDAGKEVSVIIYPRDEGVLNDVTIGYASDFWFQTINSNTVLLVSALIICIFGLGAVIAFCFLYRYLKNIKQILYIGLLMVDTGMWIISESKLRQLFMESPSKTNLLAIWTISLVGILAGIYFDYVEKKRHHHVFLIVNTLMSAQILINTILHFTGLVDIHDTLIFSHIWMAVGLFMCFATIFMDMFSGKIKEYRINSIGMGLFILLSLAEIVEYYFNPRSSFGVFVSIGMMIVLFTTVFQTIVDEIKSFTDKEDEIRKASLTTVETIMSSVDAKDEYTGGHSERVAEYVELLARATVDKYGFTEEDIVRIKYIGLLHDIGKIGIPDRILNKSGKLTEDEYTLMKRHTVIGDDLLSSFEEIEGLADGIRHHHEKFDGSGYPDSISGDEISIVARMICLADCYDAMTSNRVYRKRLSDEDVIAEIKRCSGNQFDPYLADKFCELIESGELRHSTKDGLEVNKEGRIMNSAKLENLLNSELAQKKEFITNPSFVRMVCSLIKKAEKNGIKTDIWFIDINYKNKDKFSKEEREELSKMIIPAYSGKMREQDIAIQYKDDCILLVFFDRAEDEIKECIDSIIADISPEYATKAFKLP